MLFQPELNRSSAWYVIYTIPKNEKKVYNELAKRDVKAFLPMQKVERQWKDRKKTIDVPLFPNYLFVDIAQEKLWSVLTISGVVRYITYNGSPAIVRDAEMELINRIVLNNGEVLDQNFFRMGDAVRVKQGPFSGLEGEILNIKGRDRFVVEIKVINKLIAIDIPAAYLGKRVLCQEQC